MLQPLASGHSRAGAEDRVTYGVINLILHGAIARPSTGHNRFHSFSWPDVGTQSVWFNAGSSLRSSYRVMAMASGGLFGNNRRQVFLQRCRAYPVWIGGTHSSKIVLIKVNFGGSVASLLFSSPGVTSMSGR